MPIEFIGGPDDEDTTEIHVDGITIPGVFQVSERGAGIHEEYRAEVESRSGGQDTADEPPAAEIDVQAWIDRDTYLQLNVLREAEEPFDVQIGPFAYERMGIANLEGTVRGEQQNAMQLSLKLREFREVIIQERNLGGGGGGDGAGSVSGVDASGPPSAWVDETGDGRDDRTGEPIPETETVPLPSGQQWHQVIGSDEGWGRVLLDASAGGAEPVIDTDGSNWALQDIGLRGQLPNQHSTVFNLTERGGSSLVRNVYLGDGSVRGRQTGMWFNNSSSGDIAVRNVYVNGMSDNGMYFSAPSPNGAEVLVEDSLSTNNGISNYRTGLGTIRNSVGYHDGSGNGLWGGRVLWAWVPGPVNLEGVHFDDGAADTVIQSGEDPSGGSVVNIDSSSEVRGGENTVLGGVINGSTSGSPNLQAVDGLVPGSPEDAAVGWSQGTGSSGAGGGSPQDGVE